MFASPRSNDNLVLTGTVAKAQDAARTQDLAAQFMPGPRQGPRSDQSRQHAQIGAHEQVMLKVRVAEMERQIAKQLASTFRRRPVGGVPSLPATCNPYGLVGQALSAASGAQFGDLQRGPATGLGRAKQRARAC